jgi:MoaA/NifB/PqqE/SkfB family radical SAM enzyme
MEQGHFKQLHENDTYNLPEDFPVVDELFDWLIDKQRQGWKMVDSIRRLQNMKGFMRGVGKHWGCRAGQNWLIIRTNGTLAPCFPLYNATYDWGHGRQREIRCAAAFRNEKGLRTQLFSTLGYNVA